MPENQVGFRLFRSTMKAIYLLKRSIEKYREMRRDIFIDLQKVYNRLPNKSVTK